jgi:hypothetical protein
MSVPSAQIPNYLVHSILMMLFCCLPFGIVALVFASQVNSKIAAGDIAGAQEASNTAKKWLMIGLGCWLVVVFIYFVTFMILLFGKSMN